MYKSLFVLAFVVCIVESAIYADLYALRANGTIVDSVVSIDFENGYETLAYLNGLGPNFQSWLNLTYYDSNSETFIVGNADPPLMALVNTFNKQVFTAKLPLYGLLCSLTAYDGIIYALLGLDEDVPNLGSLVGYQIANGDNNRLAKFKIDPSQSFVIGAPITWLPHKQAYLIELEESTGARNLYLLSITANSSILTFTGLEGGYTSLWFDVTTDNRTVIAYKGGAVYGLNLELNTVRVIYDFNCFGLLAVDFQKQTLYHLSNCDTLIIESYSWFYNTSGPIVDLDPQLENIANIQSVGTYIPFLCGAPCGTHPDCAQSKTCNTCRLGTCTTATGDCNAFCMKPQDCFAGVCVGNCEFNRCGKRGCGMKCTNHDECIANSKTCQICRGGQCVDYGNCGAYCLTPMDCYEGACVGSCKNFQCSI